MMLASGFAFAMCNADANIMQRIHLVCLVLTGVCVLILCIGIGIGIAHGKGNTEDGVNSNDTSLEYVQYDEDYVGADQRSWLRAGVGVAKPPDQNCEGTIKIFMQE